MSENEYNLTKITQKEHLEEIYKSIILIIRNYMDKNFKNELKIKEKLKEIYINVQNIIDEEEPRKGIKILINKNLNLEEEIKELKSQIKELEEKAIFIPEEKEKISLDIKSTFSYLKSKLKAKNEKLKTIELKYIYYIEKQNKKISQLEKKLFKLFLKNLPHKQLKQIRVFPNLKQFSDENELNQKTKKLHLDNIYSDFFLTSRTTNSRNNDFDLKQTFSDNNIINHNQIKLEYDFNNYYQTILKERLKEKPKNIEQFNIFHKIKEFNSILSHHSGYFTKKPLTISMKKFNDKKVISS